MALDFGAGCVGGAAGVIVGQPFDTVKVRLQVQHGKNGMYKGVLDCVTKMIKQESMTSLYKGMTPPLLGLAFQNAIIFGLQGQFRTLTDGSIRGELIAGSVTGGVQAGITAPIELAKIRLQIQGTGGRISPEQRKYKGPIQTVLKIRQEEGSRSCFRGLFGVLLRDVPATAIYFGSFAYLNSKFIPAGGTIDSLSAAHLLFTGGCAGMLSWAALYPIDVIKTRIQAEGMAPHGRYKSYFHCFVQSVKEEGYMWATRGFGATMLRAFPVNGAILATVTLVLRFMKTNDEELIFED
ncbi:mitochondrial basic amino acids transporter-like [Hydractinia symbiolongicarpus]|uniref:mitochondrial basic amino acids transporter-like n=1 Tax=Hydractinia symbiolongicarpus TaxID=13093 RepID=UPI0025514335|nr:mitochondrial basic amino acids transporter-like [Hydractinia symbiolongicarpus]XP_057315723.1 mitochondrial basic amino acids transporter-like [Hydractinia symbiolongicarpus]XP_057315724.1 mitochondrial basic amino acids transporter-like [Hydractinia symbiolongicarpus]